MALNDDLYDKLSDMAAWTAPCTFARTEKAPLDSKSCFETYADLMGYINDATYGTAYPGQIVAVTTGQTSGAYILMEVNNVLTPVKLGDSSPAPSPTPSPSGSLDWLHEDDFPWGSESIVEYYREETAGSGEYVLINELLRLSGEIAGTSGTPGTPTTSIPDLDYAHSITFGNTVTSIGDYAFYGVESDSEIGENATALDTIIIPDTVTSIGNYAFAYATQVRSVTLGNGVITIGNNAFQDTIITNLVMPASVTTLGNEVFANMGDGENTVVIDFRSATAIPTIGTGTFGDNTNYTIIVPDALETDWKASENWSAMANHIVGASEYSNP